MKRNILLTTFLLVVITLSISAQKFKPSPAFLKGEKQINVVIDYSHVIFNGTTKEKLYQDKGQEWIEEWEGKRRDDYANTFMSFINKELEKIGISAGDFTDAGYTLIVDIIDCYLGVYAGPFSKPATLKSTVKIVKTGKNENLTSVTLKVAQNSYAVIGTPVDFDRTFMAFSKLGEQVGEILVKALK
jgi:hypothetical protein